MIPAYTDDMPESATYWPPGQNDGFGGTSYGAPVVIACRWQNKATLFRDNEGREVTSEAVVYVDRALENKGKLHRGESISATPPAGSGEIRQTGESPDLDLQDTLHKVML